MIKEVNILLKSKLINRYDFTTFVIPEELAIKEDKIEKQVEETFSFVAKKHVTLVETDDVIVAGDIVSVNIESANTKLNQNSVQVSVGIGFNKHIEEQVLGMKRGEVKTISLNGDSAELKVLSTKRRIVPEVTDEFIEGLDIENVHTIAEYRAHLHDEFAEQLKKQNVYKIAQAWIKEGVERSEFDIHEDDVNNKIEKMKKSVVEANSTYEDYVKAYASVDLKNPTFEESEAYIRKSLVRSIKELLLGQSFDSKEGHEYNQESYEKQLEEMANKENEPVATLKEKYSYEDYLQQSYTMLYYNTVLDMCKKRIKLND